MYTRVVSRFLSSRFHSNSGRLFPFYFSNIMLRTDLLKFRVTGAVFKIAGEMRGLPAYFDNPGIQVDNSVHLITLYIHVVYNLIVDIICSLLVLRTLPSQRDMSLQLVLLQRIQMRYPTLW